MSKKQLTTKVRVPISKSLRHLIVFQFKLLADALRDFMFSPLSVAAFVIDAIFRPSAEKSLTLRLMAAGRNSDRVINLFNEYSKTSNYTLDDSVSEVEAIFQAKKRQNAKDKKDSNSNP